MLYFYTCLIRGTLEDKNARLLWAHKIEYLESAGSNYPGMDAMCQFYAFLHKYAINLRSLI